MSTYVMSDIHGCFNEFKEMLLKIQFPDNDKMIIAGDYIDRGPDSDRMLDFICEHIDDENYVFLKGNHDVEFAGYVDLIMQVVKKTGAEALLNSNDYAKDAYVLTFAKCIKELGFSLFDYYETVKELIYEKGATLGDLCRWAKAIKSLKYVQEEVINDKRFIIVHAGYIEELENHELEGSYASLEEFYIYARDDAYISGGVPGATIIAGHTPTILEDELTYNDGEVYYFYDEETDCKFYDIDCGGVYGHPNSNFVAMKLETGEMVYYKESGSK